MPDKEIAIALVIRQDKVLMVRRKNDAELSWQFPSGEIEEGETPEEAAVREVGEETKVTCDAQEVIGWRVHPITGRTVRYVACSWTSGEPTVGDPEELDRVEWVDKTEVHERVPVGIAPAVQKFLDS